ncbi:PAS domain S-box protein [Thermithiobacillus tepidarius DSM 3134]|uniref:PAS domain S-box protein n=2 Tax=Thermithiobacillus tepidarius TaxID=929 RepID=UPI003AAFF5A5
MPPDRGPPASTAARALAWSFRLLAGLLLLSALLYGVHGWYAEKGEKLDMLLRLSGFTAKSADQFFDQYARAEHQLGQELLDSAAWRQPARAHALLLRFKRLHPELASVNLIRPDGQILASTLVAPGRPLPHLRRSPQLWSQFQATMAGNRLHVLRPQHGPISKQWIMPLQYPVRDASGRLQFVLSGTLLLSQQQALWRNVALPAGTAMGLLRADGYLESRWPVPGDDLATLYGQPRKGPLVQALKARPEQVRGTYQGVTDVDGEFRLGAYYRLSGYPLTAFVAMPMRAVWQAWLERVQVPFVIFALMGLAGFGIYRLALRWQAVSEQERKRVEELSTRLGRILDNSFNEIYIFDAASLRFLQVSRGALRNLGYSMEEMAGMTVAELKPLSIEQFEALLEPLRSGRRNQVVFESAHRRKNGSIYPVEVRLQLSTEATPPVFVAIVQDISERKRAEEEIRQAALIMEHSPVVAFRWRPESGWPVEYVSRNVAQFGYDVEAFNSGALDYAAIIHPDDRPQVEAQVQRHFSSGSPACAQSYRILTKSGEVRWVEDYTTLLRGDGGRVFACEGVVIDITERKQAQEAVQTLNRALEQRVAERTAELVAVNRELEAFSYSVSHDLRAPLRAIDGFSQALLEDHAELLDPEGRRYLERVRHATQRMSHLIDDLLGLAQVTRSEMRWATVNLSEIAWQVAENLYAAQPERQVEFVIAPDLHTEGDARLLSLFSISSG